MYFSNTWVEILEIEIFQRCPYDQDPTSHRPVDSIYPNCNGFGLCLKGGEVNP